MSVCIEVGDGTGKFTVAVLARSIERAVRPDAQGLSTTRSWSFKVVH